MGFSGTTDNSSLLPLHVQAQDTKDESIKGTNGRMAHLLLQPGKCKFEQLPAQGDTSAPLAQRVLDWTVNGGANALVDAGMSPQLSTVSSRPEMAHSVMFERSLETACQPARGLDNMWQATERSGKHRGLHEFRA